MFKLKTFEFSRLKSIGATFFLFVANIQNISKNFVIQREPNKIQGLFPNLILLNLQYYVNIDF